MNGIEQAIARFREAALLPALWPRALDGIAHACHSDGATLVRKSTTMGSIAVSTSIEPFVSQYMSGPIRDPRESRVYPTLHDEFLPDQAHFTPGEIAREPYYQEFLKPNGFGWNAVAVLQGDLMISVKRAFKRGAYLGAELDRLNKALPFIRAASEVASLTWSSRFEGELHAFEMLGLGALLIDQQGCVLTMNSCVRPGAAIDIAHGVMHARGASNATRLQKFMATLLQPDGIASVSAASALLVDAAGTPAWKLDGMPCLDALRSFHSGAAALVLMRDLRGPRRAGAGALQQAFDLTPTENALATLLAEGHSLRNCAARLKISEAHARQRLQSIFDKTRTSRQGELVALLARLN